MTPVVTTSRVTDVGGLPVHRALPHHERRTVGAWCFLDRFGPVEVSPERTMMVGPHPHMGLHTVTWLLAGEVLHTDSLGHEQLIKPGELNLMTAGHGIAHAEDARGQRSGAMDGIQFWVAQPEATRHGPAAFAHHTALPRVGLDDGEATVLMGEFGGMRSPAQTDWPLVGLDVMCGGAVAFPLLPSFDYAVAVLEGSLRLGDAEVGTNELAYVGTGHDQLEVDPRGTSHFFLLGGEPFESELEMWWNFVARDRSEIDAAYREWQAGSDRFGSVATTLERIEAPRPLWLS
jgi:redox-sensitive bicupin YhaK (pirin superfamily)